MKTTYKSLVCLTSLALASLVNPAQVRAQSMEFGGGGLNYDYALLNGDNLALYIDTYGDLGAPRSVNNSPQKPGGHLIGGLPIINSNGSVGDPNGTYAALFSPTSTASAASLQASIQAKTEEITLGNAAALDGFSIRVGTSGAYTPYTVMNPTSTPLVSGNSRDGALAATTTATYTTGGANVGVKQVVTFNTAGYKNIAQFTDTFTNNGSTPITNFQYVRAVNPNQDGSTGSSMPTSTNQSFGTAVDPSQFAVNSTGPVSGLTLSIGVRPNDPNSPGTTIYAVSGAASEGSLLTNPSYLTTYNMVNYLQLNSTPTSPGVYGATYVDRQITGLTYTTPDFQGYLAGNPADAFYNAGVGADGTPEFIPVFPDMSLVLESPFLNIPVGGSTTFTYYYSFGPLATPEPGSLSLLMGSALSLGSIAWRRRRSKKA